VRIEQKRQKRRETGCESIKVRGSEIEKTNVGRKWR
jgi:hypothetical protein